MKSYTKIYYNHFGLSICDWVACEVCGGTAVDIHHIEARGMGGDPTKSKDVIENLMAVCRPCHVKYGDAPEHLEFLKRIHSAKLLK